MATTLAPVFSIAKRTEKTGLQLPDEVFVGLICHPALLRGLHRGDLAALGGW